MRGIITTAIAICVLCIAEIGARVVAMHLPDPPEWPNVVMRQHVNRMAGDYDYLFVGSSVVMDGINPAVFDDTLGSGMVTSYNAGIPLAKMRGIRLWAENVVVPIAGPEVLVVGMTSRAVNAALIQGFYASLEDSPGLRDAAPGNADLLDEVEEWLRSRSSLIRYRAILRKPDTLYAGLRRGAFEEEIELTVEGHHAVTEEFAVPPEWDSASSHLLSFEISAEEVSALRALLDSMRAAGVEVVVVNMPVHSSYLDLHPPGSYNEYLRAVCTVVQQGGGVFVDMHRDQHDDVFVDPAHLSARGAEQLSRNLASRLAGRGRQLEECLSDG